MQVGMGYAELSLREVNNLLPELVAKEHTLREILQSRSFEASVRVADLSDEDAHERHARVIFGASEKGVRITIYYNGLDIAYPLSHNAQLCERIISDFRNSDAFQVLKLAVELYDLLFQPLQRMISLEVTKQVLSVKAEISTLKAKLSND